MTLTRITEGTESRCQKASFCWFCLRLLNLDWKNKIESNTSRVCEVKENLGLQSESTGVGCPTLRHLLATGPKADSSSL